MPRAQATLLANELEIRKASFPERCSLCGAFPVPCIPPLFVFFFSRPPRTVVAAAWVASLAESGSDSCAGCAGLRRAASRLPPPAAACSYRFRPHTQNMGEGEGIGTACWTFLIVFKSGAVRLKLLGDFP